MKLTGAQALIKSLEMEGTEVMFGLPGGAILPVYDPLIDSSIRHILVRHEQGAGHMAEGYAHATGRPGVAMVTSGPAATNIVTPLCDAYMDSIPIVVITGQVPYSVIGTDAFQECDTVGITMPVTKHNWLITDAQRHPARSCARRSTSRRPVGPARCSSTCPKDVANQTMDWYWPETVDLPGLQADHEGPPEADQGRGAAHGRGAAPGDLRGRRHPQGARRRGAARARRAHRLPGGHHADGARRVPRRPRAVPRHAGHARQLHRGHRDAEGRPAHRARARASTTASPARSTAFAPDAKIIHVDIDPAELGKVRRPDVPIVGDCRLVIEELVKAVKAEQAKHELARRSTTWHAQLREWQERVPAHVRAARGRPAQAAVRASTRCATTRPTTRSSSSGVGQHQMWTSQRWKFNHPYTWVNSGGLGTMGFAVPAAIGAKVGKPERMVWAIDGDGCFQMTAQELVTASAERIPVKIAILNNAYLGMVRQWQELFYEERYSEVYLSPDLPDYVKWAEAMGCVGIPRRHARRRRADDREGERDRRPSGRDRLPHRLPGEGVPDGRRPARRTTTSSSTPRTTRTGGR